MLLLRGIRHGFLHFGLISCCDQVGDCNSFGSGMRIQNRRQFTAHFLFILEKEKKDVRTVAALVYHTTNIEHVEKNSQMFFV